VAGQAEHGAHHDAGQDHHPDDVEPPVRHGADNDAQGRQHAADHERGHRAHPGRAQQTVGDQRPAEIEDDDHRDLARAAQRPVVIMR